jgi:hypothetical protein
VAQQNDAVADATRTLYAASPEEFMATRGELARQARTAGDAAAAQQIEKLRKPTVGAWIVNLLAHEDPSVVDRLTDLGDRLRAAQERLDATRLRELSLERRSLVAELAKKAFGLANKRQPPAGLRDEVTGTLEAAIADPEIADRLGRLPRAEQWSGFGFLPTGAPQLTVVRGGKDSKQSKESGDSPRQKAGHEAAPPKKSAAERRRQERELAKARSALEEAETAFDDAQAGEQDLTQRVKQLTKKLAKLQDELESTREALDGARKEVSSSRSRRREARSTLDRAERAAQE